MSAHAITVSLQFDSEPSPALLADVARMLAEEVEAALSADALRYDGATGPCVVSVGAEAAR
jgi:hypothetical protein